VAEEAVELPGDVTELIAEPASGVVRVGEDGSRGHDEDFGYPIVDVEDRGGGEPAALREAEVGYHLQGR